MQDLMQLEAQKENLEGQKEAVENQLNEKEVLLEIEQQEKKSWSAVVWHSKWPKGKWLHESVNTPWP